MRETMANMAMAQPEKPWTAADRTGPMVQMMTTRLESMKAITVAEKALYAVLTYAQKDAADELLGGPMRGMGM
jgi:LTXXQ motif family protein